MRRRSLYYVLSAICISTAACFPDYSFDLAELDDPDAALSDDASSSDDASDDPTSDASADGEPPEDAGDDAADGDLDAGTDGDVEDAGDDADTLDSGSDPDGDVADPDSGADPDAGDDGGWPTDEPDCADEADAGALYACVPRAPSGWSGPVALFNAAAVVTPPSCPSGFVETPVFEGHSELATPPATCSTCSCSVSGVTCSSPQPASPDDEAAVFFSEPECAGGCGWVPPDDGNLLKPGMCVGLTFGVETPGTCSAPRSVQLGLSTPSGTAKCEPSTQTPTIPPVAWADNARACHASTSDKGCESGFVCAPKANHPFEDKLCIVRIGEGDVSCPEGPYSQKHVFYRDAQDTRSCTDCDCGSATNVRCEGELQTYASTTGCSNQDGVIPLGTCGDFPPARTEGDGFSKWFRLSVQPKASCSSSGGEPIGTVTPTRPQTICYMP